MPSSNYPTFGVPKSLSQGIGKEAKADAVELRSKLDVLVARTFEPLSIPSPEVLIKDFVIRKAVGWCTDGSLSLTPCWIRRWCCHPALPLRNALAGIVPWAGIPSVLTTASPIFDWVDCIATLAFVFALQSRFEICYPC